MRNLKFLITLMVTVGLFMGSNNLSISQGPRGGGGAPIDTTILPREKVYETLSRGFSVDKETIKSLEAETSSLMDTVRLIILARYRVEDLVASGKAAKDKDKENMQEGIRYFQAKLKEGAGWGDISPEVNLPVKDLFKMNLVILKGSSNYDDIIKSLEKKGMSLRHAIQIAILASKRTDELLSKGKFTEDEQKKVLEESIEYYRDKVNKRVGWEELALEVGMPYRDLHKMTNIIKVQKGIVD